MTDKPSASSTCSPSAAAATTSGPFVPRPAVPLRQRILGPRLKTCVELVNAIEGRSIEEIFGYSDHLKFHSSMTLFVRAAPHGRAFEAALQKLFGGKLDRATLDRLG